ncbi:MAG: hypothetical protein R2713_12215 [Ilumatobacteraceae bacterium]|nr:hypothetical protein [Acidimicrobiales bacterium]MCB9392244.1 hypothetical protein [Acidimicrobiaceae bacterium]
MSLKQMALRHAGACRVCGVALPAKTTAVYDFTAKNVLCLSCHGDETSRRDEPVARPGELAAAGVANRRGPDRRVGERRRASDAG